MQILDVLFDPILPVSAIMVLGFINGRSGSASVEDARAINRFAMSVLLPLLVFDLVANAPMIDFGLIPIATYAGTQMLIFALGYLLATRIFRREKGEAVLLAFCGIFANNAFYVLPIAVLIYGEGNVVPITAIITLDSTLTIGGTIIILQIISLGRAAPREVLRSVLGTPLIQAILLGTACRLLGISIPSPVNTFLDFCGAATAPAALYALGIVMSQARIRADPVVISFSAIKLLVFPGAIWLGLSLFAPDHNGLALYQLGSAGPAGVTGMSLALLYNISTDAIAPIIVWTSLLTLFTLAALA